MTDERAEHTLKRTSGFLRRPMRYLACTWHSFFRGLRMPLIHKHFTACAVVQIPGLTKGDYDLRVRAGSLMVRVG